MATYIENVKCSDNFLLETLEVLGYPVVSEDIIYEIFSKDFIISHIIAEGLENYYNYFPIIKDVEFNASPTESEIKSPLENVLGIIHYTEESSSGSDSKINLMSGNPFYTASQTMTQINGLNYGTPFNYNGGTFSIFQRKFYTDSLKNLMGGNQYYCKYDELNDTFKVKSASNSKLYVQVGCYSPNVDDIPKNKRVHFLRVCKALLGIRFANTIKLMNSDLPLEINHEDLYDECSESLEKEEEWMQQNSTIPLLR